MPGRSSRFLFRLRPKQTHRDGRDNQTDPKDDRGEKETSPRPLPERGIPASLSGSDASMPPPKRPLARISAGITDKGMNENRFVGSNGGQVLDKAPLGASDTSNSRGVMPPYRNRRTAQADASTSHERPRKSARLDPALLSGLANVPDPIKSMLSDGDTFPTHESLPAENSEVDLVLEAPLRPLRADSSILPPDILMETVSTTEILGRVAQQARQPPVLTTARRGYTSSVPRVGVPNPEMWKCLDQEADPVKQVTQLLIWSLTRRLERLEEKRVGSEPSTGELAAILALKTLRNELVQTHIHLSTRQGQALAFPRKPNPSDEQTRRELPLFKRLRDRLDTETRSYMSMLRESEAKGPDIGLGSPAVIVNDDADRTRALVTTCQSTREQLCAELGRPDAIGARAQAALDRARQQLTVTDTATDGIGVLRLLAYAPESP